MKRQITFLTVAMLFSVASAFAQGGTTGPLTWNLNGGTLTISGSGAMPDYDHFSYIHAPWYEYRGSINTVIMQTGVTSIGDWAFYECQKLTSVTIPNSVTTIGGRAFAVCESLTSIIIPNSVTSIGAWVFGHCISLISITIPNGVKTVEGGSFEECTSLTSVTIPNSVTAIKTDTTAINPATGGAFYGCTSLASITIPNSVTSIEMFAFYNCASLTSITVPNGIKTIEPGTFSGCTSLTSITIPNSVTSIGMNAFYNCASLTSITIPNSVKTIETGAFSSCTSLTSITIPNGVTAIGIRAFSKCESLTSIIIPNGVTTIEGGTFENCTSLASITIPNSVTSIKMSAPFGGAFRNCKSLTSITIPNSVTSIGGYTFAHCTSLTSITNLSLVPIGVDPLVFEDVNIGACTLTVATSAVSAYENAEIWKEFKIVGGGFLVNPISGDNEQGYTIGDGLYGGRATATVEAVARSGYHFVNWTKAGVEVSKGNPYTFTVTEDVELVANFAEGVGVEELGIGNYELRVFPNPTSGVLHVETQLLRQAQQPIASLQDVEIFDMMGRHVQSLRVNVLGSNPEPETLNVKHETVIDISHLPSGIYFVRIAGKTVRFVKG